MDNEANSTINDIFEKKGFFSMKHNKRLKSARTQDALYSLPKAIAEIRNPTLPAIENIEDLFDNLESQGVKIIIPSNIVDTYTRLEILLGLKLSSHTDSLTEASNLIDELYRRGEFQNKQQYRNALNKFSTI